MLSILKKSASLMAVVLVLANRPATGQEPVSFNKDIRPILAANCFACHGPDEENRKSDLRVDIRAEAVDYGAIVPGETDESLLVERIFETDDELLMPPPHSDHVLDLKQKELLKRWVAEGAKYDQHWAFKPPRNPAVPLHKHGDGTFAQWPRNAIDQFALDRMLAEGLKPAPEADKYTLVRRVYLDLIGMPPSIDEADKFVNSQDPEAYERLVYQLLNSPRYGEHWARAWLDLARYADTNGYEKDRERSIWPFRDWVIRALNNDMPYDQFSIEQLAGDMLPNPTVDQMIATGFHRNTMLNEEGGIDPLEYRYLAMVDRVATTGTVWLGMSIGCAQCHTHKYDPISHTDYYAFMGLLNNSDEPDFTIPETTKSGRRRQTAEQAVQDLESKLESKFPVADGAGEGAESERRQANLEIELQKWIETTRENSSQWSIMRPTEMKSNLPHLELQDDGSIFASGDVTKRDEFELTFELNENQLPLRSIRLEAIPDDRLPNRGPGQCYYEGRKGDFFVSEVTLNLDGDSVGLLSANHCHPDEKEKWNPRFVFDGDGSSGWRPNKHIGQRLQLVVQLKDPIEKAGEFKVKLLFERHYVASLGRFRVSGTSDKDAVATKLPENVERTIVSKAQSDWSTEERAQVKREFLLTTEHLAEAHKELEEARKKIGARPYSMVMQERPAANPRKTYRHHRGEYLSPREEVSPAIPELFTRSTPDHQSPTNRLELARWLVSESNPLAARVAANRAWRSFFGAGLIRTSGDFGVQSQPPSHPELLDWLAVQFMEDAWSMKKLHRLIVTSATYRQSSDIDEARLELDPENIYLARGPRFRLTGEMFRDSCLKSSGVLSPKMYGHGQRPPQPNSVTQLAWGNAGWPVATGPERYRRSIYTFTKRTAAFAAFTVFDGPTGESCVARRNRSNTPLQALTLLNDDMFIELAKALAKQADKTTDKSTTEKLVFIFRSVLTRPPTDTELTSLMAFYEKQSSRLENAKLKPAEISGEENGSSELAALTMISRVVMNLDEAVMKQ